MTGGGPNHVALDAVLDVLATDPPNELLRLDLARPLMELLGADYFASYVRDADENIYARCVSVNISDAGLASYDTHFQFDDPLTPAMAAQRRAAIVDRTVDRRELERTEFYNDFLATEGLHHGMNYFAYRHSRHLADLRIWRSRNSRPFGDQERQLLDLVAAAFSARLALDWQIRHHADLPPRLAELLTERERQIALAVAAGASDRELCAHLHLSYGTVRTHIAHIFEKWGVESRLGIVAAVRGDSTNSPMWS